MVSIGIAPRKALQKCAGVKSNRHLQSPAAAAFYRALTGTPNRAAKAMA
jgi:hypothetical protein